MNKTIFIPIIGMLALLISQGYWLNSMYKDYKAKNAKQIEEILSLSIQDEITSRWFGESDDTNNPKLIIRKASDMTPEEREKLKGDTIYLKHAQKVGLGNSFAEVLEQKMRDDLLLKRPINMESMDSIFAHRLEEQAIKATFQIIFYDKQHKVKKSSTETYIPQRFNYIETKQLPIGTLGDLFVQAKVTLAPYSILQDMFIALLISCLIACIIFGCLYYQLVVIRRAQQKLRAQEAAVQSAIHDLKSPLNTVFTILDSIEQKETDPFMLTFLQDSKIKVRRLCEIIESMLSMLKKHTTIDKQTVEINLPEMIEQINSGLALSYKEKEYTYKFIYQLPSPIIHVCFDHVNLERCLRNLLENALKYSNNGVTITVSAWQDNEQIRLSVKDNGWGIPKKAQKKIGTLFYRVKQAGKPSQPGYGIGLYGIRQIIEERGGVLTFLSKENEGSEFIIHLPR